MSYRKLLQTIGLALGTLLLVRCGTAPTVVPTAAPLPSATSLPTSTPLPLHKVNEVVEVDGWQTVQLWLVKGAFQADPKGEKQTSGWRVSVKSAGTCKSTPLAEAGKEFYCVTLGIENTTATSGALDLASGGLVLSDPKGSDYVADGVRLGDTNPFVLAAPQKGSISSSVQCSFSAPTLNAASKPIVS